MATSQLDEVVPILATNDTQLEPQSVWHGLPKKGPTRSWWKDDVPASSWSPWRSGLRLLSRHKTRHFLEECKTTQKLQGTISNSLQRSRALPKGSLELFLATRCHSTLGLPGGQRISPRLPALACSLLHLPASAAHSIEGSEPYLGDPLTFHPHGPSSHLIPMGLCTSGDWPAQKQTAAHAQLETG